MISKILCSLVIVAAMCWSYPVNAAVYTIPQQPVEVDEDEKLPFKIRGKSSGGNNATLTNVTHTLSDPTFGTIEPKDPQDPPSIDAYFVPSGQLGVVRLDSSGTNKKGNVVTGFVDIDVVVGAALTIEIETLPPVPIVP